ncbi:MAG: hypothetical protein JJ992_21680 [Planctomycetes bacterium]|nr:hypothetical protein [Planctomycetota bacterium]
MRVLIACDDQAIAQRIRAVLTEHGVECPAGHIVPLDAIVDRGGLLLPDLMVMALPADTQAGLAVLRETHNTLPRLHVIVLGPATDPKLILETLKQGAAEFLDSQQLESELSGAVRRFQSLHKHGADRRRGGRVITVVSPSGGGGASTLAASIGAVLAQEHATCGLVDLRLGVSDLAPMLDLRPGRTLADLCDHVSRLDQSLFEQFLSRHASGVHLLPAPTRQVDLQRVTSRGVRRALALARVRFPYVVVDMDHSLESEQIEALWQADAILLIIRLDYTSIRNTRRMVEAMMELGIERELMHLVVNGYGQRRQLALEQAEAALGLKVVHQIPYDPASVNLSINSGVPVVLKCRFARITRSIRALAHSVNGAAHIGAAT